MKRLLHNLQESSDTLTKMSILNHYGIKEVSKVIIAKKNMSQEPVLDSVVCVRWETGSKSYTIPTKFDLSFIKQQQSKNELKSVYKGEFVDSWLAAAELGAEFRLSM